MNVLVTAASKEGATGEIAEAISDFRNWSDIDRWASQIADTLVDRGVHEDAEPLSQLMALSTSFPHEIGREGP